MTAAPWWRPDVHADRRPFLLGRARILAALRRWLEVRGFLEVDPAILQVSPGNEAHLHAFATELRAVDGSPQGRRYLHTSPEFACKKLLAAGETRLFTLAHVFRDRERGPLHHPEFTMLEWYRAHEPYAALMADCAALLAEAAAAVGARRLACAGREVDPLAEPLRITVAEAFDRFAGIDLLRTVQAGASAESPHPGPPPPGAGEGATPSPSPAQRGRAGVGAGATDRDALAAAVRAAGIRVADDDTWSDLFSRVLVERVEPRLGQGRATVLCEYPVAEAALARPKPDDPRVAERFELYACGVELANGFGELTDPHEQRRRFEAEMALKERVYGERYPLDEELLAALALMPPASGVALGFDRLVMLATGASRIEQVLWAPVAG